MRKKNLLVTLVFVLCLSQTLAYAGDCWMLYTEECGNLYGGEHWCLNETCSDVGLGCDTDRYVTGDSVTDAHNVGGEEGVDVVAGTITNCGYERPCACLPDNSTPFNLICSSEPLAPELWYEEQNWDDAGFCPGTPEEEEEEEEDDSDA